LEAGGEDSRQYLEAGEDSKQYLEAGGEDSKQYLEVGEDSKQYLDARGGSRQYCSSQMELGLGLKNKINES
jgi:hypothetical protein